MQTQIPEAVEAPHAVLPRNEILATITEPDAPLYLLSTREAAAALGLKEQTLAVWRQQDRGPAFTRLGNVVRYRSTDLLAWLDANVQRPSEV